MSIQEFYLELSGSHRELGRAHGEALRGVIHTAIEKWQDFMAQSTGMPFADLMARFLRDTNYQAAIEQWAPHLAEEVRGIAEGADLGQELVYSWQMVDELLDYVIEYMYAEKCSTLGGYQQAQGLAPVLGKTQDLLHCYLGTAAVVRTRYADSDIDILNSTIAGIITQDGMSQQLGLCLNHIGHLDRNPSGLPVTFVARLLLEQCASVEEGAALLHKIPHASGMNYGLIDRAKVRTFEVSSSPTATQIEEFQPLPELKRIWHTNHPVANRNYCRDVAMWQGLADSEAANTQKRFEFLQRELSIVDRPLTVERAKELLSSREAPISAEPEDAYPTINSAIMEFSEQPTLFFSPGAPSQCDYVAFRFD